MTNKSTVSVLIGLALIMMVTAEAVRSDGGRLPIPEGVFYYQPAATVHGLEAAWVNPAELSKYDLAGFQVMADYNEGEYLKSWGLAVGRQRLLTAYRHLDEPFGTDFDEFLTAAGFGLGAKLDAGLSYRYFKEGPGAYNNRHYWTVGLVAKSRGPWRLGAVWSNLNRGRIDGERTAVEHRYSLGYRPFGDRLTMAADMFLSGKQAVNDADFVYHAEIVARPGLYIEASVDSDWGFQIGLRANLLKYFTGSRSTFDGDGNHRRTTVFVGATSKQQPSIIAYPRQSLTLSVSGGPSENPPQPVFGSARTPFVELIAGVYRAAEDPSISELVLQIGQLSMGFGQAQEFREALAYFRAQGKRVVCHLGSPNNIGYYVATVADTVLIPPVCQLGLVGLRAELTFWTGALDKLGVKLELLRIGDHKTAPEQYTLTAASPENREQIDRLLDDQYDQFVAAIADGRELTQEVVRRLIDQGPFTSAEALECGLVDGLSYRDRVRDDFGTRLPEITFNRYLSDTLTNDHWMPRPVLAVVVAEGSITADGGGDHPFGSAGGVTPSPMARAFAITRSDPDIRGVVFRINSPGGGALSGEDIYRSVQLAAERKPMIVSMANVAASGGYYIATPSRKMFLNPATITGSIGIFGGKADFSGLYEKLAVGKELYTRGRFAGMLTTARPFTEEERQKYMGRLEAFYGHFVDLVAESRGLTPDSVDALSRGRVWTGREAVANGLADELGGVHQALTYLADSLGLAEYRVRLLPEKRPWFVMPELPLVGRFMSLLAGEGSQSEAADPIELLTVDEGLIARLPYDIWIE